MICKNCGAFFVRYPCPSCGAKDETEIEVKGLDETVIRPSELKGRSSVNPKDQEIEIEEKMVKPSELKGRSAVNPDLVIEEDPDRIVKPSELQGRSSVNPNYRIEEDIENKDTISKPSVSNVRNRRDTIRIGSLSTEQEVVVKSRTTRGVQIKEKPESVKDEEITNELAKASQQKIRATEFKDKMETDEEYRTRVRETLMEVMSLLEKLVED